MPKITCTNCGKEIEYGAGRNIVYCNECGYKYEIKGTAPEETEVKTEAEIQKENKKAPAAVEKAAQNDFLPKNDERQFIPKNDVLQSEIKNDALQPQPPKTEAMLKKVLPIVTVALASVLVVSSVIIFYTKNKSEIPAVGKQPETGIIEVTNEEGYVVETQVVKKDYTATLLNTTSVLNEINSNVAVPGIPKTTVKQGKAPTKPKTTASKKIQLEKFPLTIATANKRSGLISIGANHGGDGNSHVVSLKKDGTVVAAGSNDYGECDVSGWKDVISVTTGTYHTVGLKKDGTVVATGGGQYGQTNVSSWKDIVSISANNDQTIGVKKDGTVVTTSYNLDSSWSNIIAVSMDYDNVIGLKKDGTVVAVGDNDYGQCNVSGWKDIVAVSSGREHTVGLKKDGTVVATGWNEYGQCDVSGWKDIVAISAGYWHTVGLKKDGTVVAVGGKAEGKCNVSSWKNIVAVSTGQHNTFGLKKDGTVVVVGGDYDGQNNVASWYGLKTP